MRYLVLVFWLFIYSFNAYSQRQIQINGFGHLEYENNRVIDDTSGLYNFGGFTLGEHDLFVSSNLHDRINFLGEFVFKGDNSSASGFLPSIERARIRYNYHGNHYVLFGKMHTAINYWNDVYHHGRIFFPTIDRPLNFQFFVPIHSLGIRFQGQDIGKLRFGYDFQIANGMESTDISSTGQNFSYNLSFHIKPSIGTRIMVGYNADVLPTNTHGPHAHSGNYHNHMYKDEVRLDQFHFSFAHFQTKLEILNEFAVIHSNTDSLGNSMNYTNYTYVGYRIKEKYIPYVMLDALVTSTTELHVKQINALKMAIGMRFEINDKINIKSQIEKYGSIPSIKNLPQLQDKYEFKLQLSYAI